MDGQICQICGDTVGITANGDVFVACNECAFPVCRPCYEYERRDGNQCCPQCKSRYKRLKGELLPLAILGAFCLSGLIVKKDIQLHKISKVIGLMVRG